MVFNYLPTPKLLHGLAKGRLAERLQRAVRLWVLLYRLYGPDAWAQQLPQPFRYGDLRDLLFAQTHGHSETAKVAELTQNCDFNCCCQRTLTTWLVDSNPAFSLADWQQEIIGLSDLTNDAIETALESCPFATVHRSIRDDLSHLVELGWLTGEGKGRFCTVAPHDWPLAGQPPLPLGNLSVAQTWEVLRSLESISFVQPNLHVIVQSLWEQLTSPQPVTTREPEQRIFIHLDYILSGEMQEHVDTLQEQIEQLWRSGGGVIRFDYWISANEAVPITVYPVCLHYSRRAKYLSAYGDEPAGVFGWHNYRLDRIASPRLRVFAWGAPQVPESLREMRRTGQLPTSEQVSAALDEAWGFNFYLPRRLLIMRFPSEFARWYVDQTERHSTFQSIDYGALPKLVKQEIGDANEQVEVLDILARLNPQDAYYQAWVRLGDINIVMRLRDWRPKGEVIAPLELRRRMRTEAAEELGQYEMNDERGTMNDEVIRV
ncbi:TIGR03985 family CRISPR-associated protein [Leptolyngbya cf. ectocarpi LEGE 11479]|uniref:TIGR03985 family CRISPR-associated protein n=1 Tax=Leptolyngbya cf. ectocarpi LEGE 11479 TaxID=1828722 RepID=A0A929F691_LEPEC|nr:TIGR03985 family CRISPR-associated protein [Leptolyngbya ectocarpi]MBE9067521.1 TIGR03985 family CRISPR-associated protein [Leptolyngbya cf. ectocarpi LEGE 11479]